MTFTTQVSIDAAKDEELLQMCADAGLTNFFIGIETPNEDSLRESKKRQNLRINLTEQVQRFLNHGMKVTGGMIVGFDSDDLGIFQRQRDFAMSTPVPIFSVGALVAPEATPLHARMAREGRLVLGEEVAALPWSTNIIPHHMSRDELMTGLRWLCNSLYNPSSFEERVSLFIEKVADVRSATGGQAGWLRAGTRSVDADAMEMISRVATRGTKEAKMVANLRSKAAGKPRAAEILPSCLLQYSQIRYMYETAGFWEDASPSSISPYSTEQPRSTAVHVGRSTLPVLS